MIPLFFKIVSIFSQVIQIILEILSNSSSLSKTQYQHFLHQKSTQKSSSQFGQVSILSTTSFLFNKTFIC